MVFARWFFRRKQLAASAPAAANADLELASIAVARQLVQAGNELEDRGDLVGSLTSYRKAVAVAPHYPQAHLNLGNALASLGDLHAAVDSYETALALDPRYAPAHFNLGNLFAKARDVTRAERAFREALRLTPGMVDAAVALASLLESVGRMHEAVDQLRDALHSSPDNEGAAHNLGLLLRKLGRWDEAEQAFQQAVASAPSSARALSALAFHHQQMGRLREAEKLLRCALETEPRDQTAISCLLFTLNLSNEHGALEIFREHARFGAMFEEPSFPGRVKRSGARNSLSQLKVGYLSGDLCGHPVGMFLRPILKHHDRSAFQVACYSNNERDDELTRELRSYADHWCDIADMNDEAVAHVIRSDGIDVLVDLSGHTSRSRVLLFTRRCARVQATWLGYLNTTGLKSTDYRICDGYTDPVGTTEHLHTERLFRMPHSQWCYAPVYDIPVAPAPHPNEPERVIFGSFNQFPKIDAFCLDLWCEILRRLPLSELRVYSVPEGKTMATFLEALGHRGVDQARITLRGRLDIRRYFAELGAVDIALDTFPYNGATTTLDTLWMGTPLVALVGERSIARGGFSILSTLELPQLIAKTTTEFVDCNVRLARAFEWRQELRGTMRRRMERSPLMDAATFTRELEDGYRQMHAATDPESQGQPT